MRVGQRLFLAVVPAVLGVFTVAGLAYWGKYGREAPVAIVIVAAVASVVSLVIAWYNIRNIAQRIERIAVGRASSAPDELESIEEVIERLRAEASAAQSSAVAHEKAATQRSLAHDEMLHQIATELRHQLDEVRLPIHILLDNHFGDLNENQEEMLGAARSATDIAEASLRSAEVILGTATGSLELRRDRVRAGDLIVGLLTPLRALAERRTLVLREDVPPAFGAVNGDRARLQDALQAIFEASLAGADALKGAQFVAEAIGQCLTLTVTYTGSPPAGLPLLLARSIIEVTGGSATVGSGRTMISLPLER